jgi:hypothetical protein
VLTSAAAAAAADIRRGQGMLLAAGSTVDKPIYKAVTCNSGSNYGSFGANSDEGIKYKLDIPECKECPAGTSTKDASILLFSADRYACDNVTLGFYSPTACLTKPGFGFDGLQATPCPKGTYHDAQGDDANKCTPCAAGITTYSEQSQSAADCKYVLPGWQFPNAANPAANVTQCDYGELLRQQCMVTVCRCTALMQPNQSLEYNCATQIWRITRSCAMVKGTLLVNPHQPIMR